MSPQSKEKLNLPRSNSNEDGREESNQHDYEDEDQLEEGQEKEAGKPLNGNL